MHLLQLRVGGVSEGVGSEIRGPASLGIAVGEQRRGNPAQAIEYYKKALVIVDAPELRTQVFRNMGLAYQSLGDETAAQQSFYQAAHQPQSAAVDWQGDWWRKLIPMLKQRLRQWRSGSPSPPPGQ